MTVYEKLQYVQSKLNVPKNQVNKFGGYNYRSCEDIMEAIKPVLAEAGAVLVVGDDLVQIGDRYYVKASAAFIDSETGEKITNVAYARETETKKGMDDSQVTGSSSSYARKYAMNGLFCLDDVKDADTMDNSGTKKKSEKLEAKHVNSLKSELKRTNVSEKSLLANYKAPDLASLSFEDYMDAMGKLEKKPDAKPKGHEFVQPADESGLPWNQ